MLHMEIAFPLALPARRLGLHLPLCSSSSFPQEGSQLTGHDGAGGGQGFDAVEVAWV